METELIPVLERCIERLGSEFRRESAYYFWWEDDLRARLAHFVWEEVGAVPSSGIPSGLPFDPKAEHADRVVALTHLIPQQLKGHFDLAIFSPDAAVDYVTRFDPGHVAEANLLAAVEISFLYGQSSLLAKVEPDISKFIDSRERILHAYALVFVLSRNNLGRPLTKYQNMTAKLKARMDGVWRGRLGKSELKIFCVSNDPSIRPSWVI